MEGVVLQTYGAGNAPDSRSDLISELKKACDRGVIIVNCSQCASGFVTDEYAAGRVSFGNREDLCEGEGERRVSFLWIKPNERSKMVPTYPAVCTPFHV